MDVSRAAKGLYSALDAECSEIRLLTLEPAGFDEPISCSLAVASLKQQPSYNALSYVWGNPEQSTCISVNGRETWINTNLAVALRHIRNCGNDLASVQGIPIWIDALCINQADIYEREKQVVLMGDIYRQSACVIMWLGDGDEQSDWAFDRFNDPACRASVESLKTEHRRPSLEEIRLKIIIDRNLEMRSYWTRTWVLQEVVLATNDPAVLCGRKGAPLSTYIAFRNNLPFNKASYPDLMSEWNQLDIPDHADAIPGRVGMSLFHDIMRGAYRDFGSLPLGMALMMSCGLAATDTRDHVYGILGMLRSEEASRLNVDYSKHHMQVTQDAMAIVLTSQVEDSLDFFANFCFGRPVDQYPSWVPDLSGPWSQHLTASKHLSRTGPSWRHPSQAATVVNNGILQLSAIEFDTVETTLRVEFNQGWETEFRYGLGHKEVNIEPLEKAEHMAAEGFRRIITASDRTAAFISARCKEPIWRTLGAWKDLDGRALASTGQSKNDQWLSGIIRDKQTLWEILLGRQKIPESWLSSCPEALRNDTSKSMAAILSPLLHAIRSRSNDRNVFLTSSGFLGVGHELIEPGDMVVLVVGTHYPWVLRPYRDGYRMIGFAYVSGLMDWELLDECVEKGNVQEKIMKIY